MNDGAKKGDFWGQEKLHNETNYRTKQMSLFGTGEVDIES